MEQTCRLCLSTERKVFPLYSGLQQKIEVIFGVKVEILKEFPRNICIECYKYLIQSDSFRNIIIYANNKLEKMLTEYGKIDIQSCELDFTPEEPSTEVDDEYDEDQGDSNESLNRDTEISNHDKIKNEITCTTELILKEDTNYDQKDFSSNCFEPEVVLDTSKQIDMIKLTKKKDKVALRVYKCKECDYTSPTSYKLMLHQGKHKTLCNICGKYLTAYNLHQHIRMVHTYDPVSCKECGKVFKNNILLFYHARLHRIGKITCPICHKVLSRSGYSQHRRRHALGDERPAKCHLCDKAFYTNDVLAKHVRSHTGERPYLCDVCQRGFSSSNALKTHKRQHTNERPYGCEYCGVSFIAKVSLKTHLKSKHDVELK